MATGDKTYLNSMSKGVTDYYSYNASVSTTEVAVTLDFEVNNFKYITNDDTSNDLLIYFAPATGLTGKNGIIVLRPGETLQEFNKKCTAIYFKRPSGMGYVRFLAV